MKELFEHIKGREWDWFKRKGGRGKFSYSIVFGDQQRGTLLRITVGMWETFYTLPDLLANPSFCKAVWGISGSMITPAPRWEWCSWSAFENLQRKGHQACIDYIKKTII